MLTMRKKEKFPERMIEPLAVRRRRQAQEGSEAMADYRRTQIAVRERIHALRAERLARDARRKG